ncbi:MAG: hypothetical protein B7Z75_11650 [Acidocella sp. 20-57-95]|nr:MAG: hypothetical protein B7Z75_11650 [Acidocella sp. 20-57-95]HQT63145.1 tripartite tricarboxylate transporter substrate binding protein [Acidocella sp.]HQU03335.1 tripartite tricarboxylate transporter substrate binding protein [Acidocella sp.]
MLKSLLRCGAVLFALCLAPLHASFADSYPSRPITLIVPWGPGGGADSLARITSKIIAPDLGVSIPIVNMPGATGQTGLTQLLTSPADGYTMAVLTGDTLALLASPSARFKLDDFIPLGIMIQQVSGFYVNAAGPLQSWDDVVKAAKTRQLKVAITGYGSPDAITVGYFKAHGVDLQAIPFSAPGLRYTSVLGGQSDLLYTQAGDVRSFIEGKQIKPVIFFNDKPFDVAGFGDVPYSVKLGYQATLHQIRVIIVRAGTDPQIVKKLSDALAKAAASGEYQEYLKHQYAVPESYVSSADSIAYMKTWLAQAKVLASAQPGSDK